MSLLKKRAQIILVLQLPMKFDYTVIKKPNDVDTLDNQEFIDYIGDILIELLEQKVKDGTAFE